MTTIKLSKFKGDEFLKLMGNYVKATLAESKAIVSVDSGALQESTQVTKIHNGFRIYINAQTLERLSNKRYNYGVRYYLKGYTNYPAFPYIEEASETVDLSSQVTGLSWHARKPSGRRGSGKARLSRADVMVVNEWIKGATIRSKAVARRFVK